MTDWTQYAEQRYQFEQKMAVEYPDMPPNDYYLDEQHQAHPCLTAADFKKQLEQYEQHYDARKDNDPWRVAITYVGGIRVSTMFLSVNLGFNKDKPPVLFETMVFGGALNNRTERYYTWADAEIGHRQIVADVEEADANES